MSDKKEENKIKKKILCEYQVKKKYSDILRLEMEDLRHDEMHPKCSIDSGPGSGSIKDLSDYMVRLDEVMQKLQSARYECLKNYQKVIGMIESLKDEREQQVLRLHYVHNKTWDQVADEWGISPRQVQRIHGYALEHLKLDD